MAWHERLLIGVCVGGTALGASWASAQEADTFLPAAEVSADATEFRQLLGVEVTGTAILNSRSKQAVPIQVIERRDIERSSARSTVALLQQLPVFINGGEFGNLETRPGVESLGLHGHEAGTLVLLDGRRLGTYPLQMVGANPDLMIPELAMVPLVAIERVEILTGGASSRYGSDAVAGVVNLITREQVGSPTIGLDLQQPGGGGGAERTLSWSWGKGDAQRDLGSLRLFAQWRERQRMSLADQGIGWNTDRAMGQTPDGQSVYAPWEPRWLSTFGAPGQPSTAVGQNANCGPGYVYVAERGHCAQYLGRHINLYPAAQEAQLMAAWNHRLPGSAMLFGDALFSDHRMRQARFPSLGTVTAVDTGERFRFFPEPLGTGDWWERNNYRRLSAGVRGQWGETDYKVTVNRAVHQGRQFILGGTVSGWADRLQLRADELTQLPETYSPETLAKFEDIRLTRETRRRHAGTSMSQVEGLLSGRWQTDKGLDGNWAVGATHLQESAHFESVTSGQFQQSRRVAALFAEGDLQLSERLQTGMALRFDEYNDVGASWTGKWQALYRWRSHSFVRLSYGTGFRAPALSQLNPWAVPVLSTGYPDNDKSKCPAETIVFGKRYRCSDIYNVGNPDLKPEHSRQWTLGLRHEPSVNWSFGADLWRLRVRDVFGSVGYLSIVADEALYARYATPPAAGQPEIIRQVAENLGSLERSGIDIDAQYRVSGEQGRWRFAMAATHYLQARRSFAPGEPMVDELGRYVLQTEQFLPRYKLRLSAEHSRERWTLLVHADALSGNTEELTGMLALGTEPVNLVRRVPAHWTLGALFHYRVSQAVRLRLGIDNLLDRLPPERFALSSGIETHGVDTRYGNYRGRTYQLGLDLRF